MAGKGRPKTPKALNLIRGNPGKRDRPEDELDPDTLVTIPDPPFELNDDALHFWHEMCGLLIRIGVLTSCDVLTVARYCDVLAQWVFVRDIIEKEKTETQRGALQYFSTYNQLGTALVKLESEMGITPCARTRIRLDISAKPGGKSGLGAFMESNKRKPLTAA